MKTVREIFRSYGVLDADGRHVNGTDKETNHRYGEAYECLFPDRGSVELVMEVGVADGSSLLAWSEVFPNATVVGLDVHPISRAHGGRVEFHLGDMTSREDCERAAAGREFDLIVDDATHRLPDTLVALLYLWPFVKLGGLYVVEEFADVGGLWGNVLAWQPGAFRVDTLSPFGGVEPLVCFRREVPWDTPG